MEKNDILSKAIYIQYPINYNNYRNYNVENIYKLPLPLKGQMYDNWSLNQNHFTTEYHRLNSLPLLSKLLNINYNEEDFTLLNKSYNNFDISMLVPKQQFKYEIYGFTRNEHFNDITYLQLLENNVKHSSITEYHKLFKYSHESSRIINKSLNNDLKLFISGDSQMIPDIPVLSCYFKEIWYFDNRNNLTLKEKYKDIKFDKILIELNNNPLSFYIDTNLK